MIHMERKTGYGKSAAACAGLTFFAAMGAARADGDIVSSTSAESITTQTIGANDYASKMQCLPTGTHRLLQFSYLVVNGPSGGDVSLPGAPAPLCTAAQCSSSTCNRTGTIAGSSGGGTFIWSDSTCGWQAWALTRFDIVRPDGTPAVPSFTRSMCLEDLFGTPHGCSNQGFSGGEAAPPNDTQCNQVAIDGVPDGDYRISAFTNYLNQASEATAHDNANSSAFSIQSGRVNSSTPAWQPIETFQGSSAPTTSNGPTAVSPQPNETNVLWITSAGDLVYASKTNGVWASGSLGHPTGVALMGTPQAVSWGYGRLDVVARGTDNRLWQTYYDPSVGFGPWANPLGVSGVGSDPAITSWAPNRLDVFWVSSIDQTLHHVWYASGWGVEDRLVAPNGLAVVGRPRAASWAHDRLDVVVEGAGNVLWHVSWAPGWSWDNPLSIATVLGSPEIVSTRPNNLSIAWPAFNNVIGYLEWSGSRWTTQNIGCASCTGVTFTNWSPAISTRDGITPEIFVRGSDNKLYETVFTLGSSAPGLTWLVAGSGLASSPAAVSWTGTQDTAVFGSGSLLQALTFF
jgi:hypothetical protein